MYEHQVSNIITSIMIERGMPAAERGEKCFWGAEIFWVGDPCKGKKVRGLERGGRGELEVWWKMG